MLGRQIAGKPVDHAILQMQFSEKRASSRIMNMLVTGKDHASRYKSLEAGKLVICTWIAFLSFSVLNCNGFLSRSLGYQRKASPQKGWTSRTRSFRYPVSSEFEIECSAERRENSRGTKSCSSQKEAGQNCFGCVGEGGQTHSKSIIILGMVVD